MVESGAKRGIICTVLLLGLFCFEAFGQWFDNITFDTLKTVRYSLEKISFEDLKESQGVFFVKTDKGRFAKLLCSDSWWIWGNRITFQKIVVYDFDGHELHSISNFTLNQGVQLNLDTMEGTSEGADIVLKAEITPQLKVSHYLKALNGALFAFPTESLGKAKIQVESVPSGALVYIDGEYEGISPLEKDVDEGPHEVKVVKAGYMVWSKMLYVKSLEERTVRAVLMKRANAIKAKWFFQAEGFFSSAVLGDINLDGRMEVIASVSQESTVYALTSEGEVLWYFPTYVPTGPPALGDINNDGELEIIVGGGLNTDEKGFVYALSSRGKKLWLYETEKGAAYNAPVLVDLDGDGALEIVIAVKGGTLYVLRGNGTLIWKYTSPYTIASSPAVCDLDNDGKPEIILGTAGKISIFDSAGRELESLEVGDVRVSPLVGDIDGDGKKEIIVSTYDAKVYCFNYKGSLLWKTEIGEAAICASPIAGDLDGDNKVEVIVGGCYGSYPHLHVLNSHGQEVRSYPTISSLFASPLIADIDADGEKESIVPSYHGRILIIGSGGILKDIYETEGQIIASSSLGDLDNDGALELVVSVAPSSGSEGVLYALSFPSEGGEIIWSCLGGSPWHTSSLEDALSYSAALKKGARAAAEWVARGKTYGEINVNPTAAFSFTPSHPKTGQTVHFDASKSVDPDGNIVKFMWDWDSDGDFDEVTENPYIEHAFSKVGEHEVTLKVVDSQGGTDEITLTVSVIKNQPPEAKFTYAPQNPTLLDSIVFIDQSLDPDGTIVKWLWDFGDGTISSERNPTHKYEKKGTFIVKLSVEDDVGATSTATATVNVINLPPKAAFSFKPLRPRVEEEVVFDASLSDDKDGKIVRYKWDWDSDGTVDEETASPVIKHKFSQGGLHRVTLHVTDDDGATDEISQVANVLQPPEAAFDFKPINPSTLDEINFFDLSADVDGRVVSWKWDFGDGTSSEVPNPTHRYERKGAFVVRLTVTDNDGLSSTVSRTLVIRNLPPEVSLSYEPQNPIVGEEVSFKATGEDPDGEIVEYIWDFGDGSVIERKEPCVTHKFTSPGKYAITLKARDNDGAESVVTKTVNIKGSSPNANFTFTPGKVTVLVEMQFVDHSSDPDGNIVSWHWDFGDGTTSTERNPTHRYRRKGTFTVKLTVMDDDGLTDTKEAKIEVVNVPPEASFAFSPKEPYAGQEISFDASGSEDPDGKIVGYAWDFGDGETAEGIEVKHAFPEPGIYTVTLTVTDDDGAKGVATGEVEVHPVPERPPEFEELWALVVGISDYRDQNIRDLKYPEEDAKAFYDFLISPEGGGFPGDHVRLLLGEEATLREMLKGLAWLRDSSTEDDLVVFYFAGHGTFDVDKDGDEGDKMDEYLVPYDAEADAIAATCLCDDVVGYWFEQVEAKGLVVIFDSCFSGGSLRQVRSFSKGGLRAGPGNKVFTDLAAEGRIFIAAAKETEPSEEKDGFKHGVFTYFLLRGLGYEELPEVEGLPPVEGPEADKDKDGKVTVGELEEYLGEMVPKYADQHPVVLGDPKLLSLIHI